MQRLIEKLKELKTKKILVIGDLILDRYTTGSCDRISPEAPVQILKVKEVKYSIGGAGNTAVNVKTLGSKPYLIGILGEDNEADIFEKELKKREIEDSGILVSPYTKTLLKERIVASNQQLLRIDHTDEISKDDKHYNHILNKFEEFDSDIVIVSDYAKGTLSELLIENIINLCKIKNKQIIVDPRPKHTLSYKNSSFITPNFKEACEMAKLDVDINNVSTDNAKRLSEDLYAKLNSSILLTMAEHGILFYNGNDFNHFPIFKREVRDVSGAGDTVVAALAVGLANKLDIKEAIYFANHAAGVKVEKAGVKPVSLNEVIDDIKLHNENTK